jgi:hypothetical protein
MEEYIVRVYEDRTEWRQNGQRHRIDGPAVEWADGRKGYWIEDIEYTEKAFLKETRKMRVISPWVAPIEHTEKAFLEKTQPLVEELTVAEISKRLGYEIKIVKE